VKSAHPVCHIILDTRQASSLAPGVASRVANQEDPVQLACDGANRGENFCTEQFDQILRHNSPGAEGSVCETCRLVREYMEERPAPRKEQMKSRGPAVPHYSPELGTCGGTEVQSFVCNRLKCCLS
jgi:hypothetical protein